MRSTYLSKPPSYVGFDDQVGAFQAAERMYREGADVVYHAAGASGFGVFEAAASLSNDLGRDFWAIGVDVDQYRALPADDPWRPHILTSMVKQYDRAVVTLLEEFAQGEFTTGSRVLGLADGGVDLAYSGGFIEGLRPRIDALRAQVISGETDVPAIPPNKADEAAELGLT